MNGETGYGLASWRIKKVLHDLRCVINGWIYHEWKGGGTLVGETLLFYFLCIDGNVDRSKHTRLLDKEVVGGYSDIEKCCQMLIREKRYYQARVRVSRFRSLVKRVIIAFTYHWREKWCEVRKWV